MARNGEDIQLEPAANQYLIHYIPKDRSTVLDRLTEARKDLATFEASLQAKEDLVAKLEPDASRHIICSASVMTCPVQISAVTVCACVLPMSGCPCPAIPSPTPTHPVRNTAPRNKGGAC
ncbi:hypothetical protein [Pseudarthrobacter sp. PH31-O2]|uniref:hypothetical protein n=1 Tax=Pseudarthrobacter sp. PH31-O2 TaxID=3046206 RepID=UPI0024BA3EB4|nr:hypothetical protein [Pseudarthrobacter sp. PH31-O2]MDJ0354468.1 hypothetical protein [Pseudarthrobacter sp. PH31-O2]